MADIRANISELIGNTPVVALSRYAGEHGLHARIVGKIEYFNPAGSVKDRIAKAMIEDAEASGTLKPGATIIEPTSGNTGIGIAAVGASKGYRVIITMPESMSKERGNLLRALGAEIILTPAQEGMRGAIQKAKKLNQEIEGSLILEQFSNPANPRAHQETTGPEIWEQTGGKIDILVAGVGTGGTITGAGHYLQEQNPDIQIIAVEPDGSAVLSGGQAGPHQIQGIGAGFVPDTLDTDIYDEIIRVTNENSFRTARELAKTEGLIVGISSGAALWAATQVAKREENSEKLIVVILPDTGERYFSTPLLSE